MEEALPLVRADSLKIQLQRALRDRILTGHYKAGRQFPSEVELVDEYHVSRTTVRSALAGLEAEGLIQRRWGVGTFVSSRATISHHVEQALDFHSMILDAGYHPGVLLRSVATVPAAPDDAQRLEVPEGSELLRVEKVFTADDDPVIYVVNLIPRSMILPERYGEVQHEPQITEPIYSFIEDFCGQRVEYHIATLAAILARDSEIPIPHVEPLTPLLMMISVAHNRDDRPVFESRSTYPDPRIQLKLLRRRS